MARTWKKGRGKPGPFAPLQGAWTAAIDSPPRGRIAVLLAIGCGAEPVQLPEGANVVARFRLVEAPSDSGSTFQLQASLDPWEVGPERVWDRCDEAGGTITGIAPFDAGEPWAVVGGTEVRLAPSNASSSAPLWTGEIPGGRLDGEWFGGGTSGGEDLDAFDVERGVRVPAALEVLAPELDSGTLVGRDDALTVRWRGSSSGYVRWTLSDGEHAVECAALDDGRFDIPAAWLASFDGPITLLGSRNATGYHELPSGDFASFAASRSTAGDLRVGP